ncbi:LacI family transcriptional regulator [Rhizobium sp. TRM96647]|uniref:LacI family DNA-binding transcriptional regulator n=1 Tax=unclassified Rhizobium TaxID=2613769 RepID=UPI0021E8A1BF|nr:MULTISPECIES: LacI family DNA-binding transcriptional regulator [unclassified Rhizobium]MCV3739224.1 LacI family transcriptional regulator [Rhizobium sp. TRM96647]MCV3760898.1 LacI family transcriptional regulator [Rhizobium sp. TRM96650]
MSITINEVARRAGVSTTTVSNVLNGRTKRMRPETLSRVEAIIGELQYRPNRAAQSLRAGGIHTFGLVVPSVSNPFWGTFASLFETAALKHGYGVLLCNTHRSVEREQAYLHELRNDGVAGVVLGSSLPSARHLGPMIEGGMHIVTLDRSSQASDPAGLADISVDNTVGAALIGDHLWQKGHRIFGFIAGEAKSINRQERVAGFLGSLNAHGVATEEVYLWPFSHKSRFKEVDLFETGRKAAREIIKTSQRRVTAIAAVNDLMAVGAYRGIRDEGLDVGTDIAVVGFDDTFLATIVQPTLTTVRQPLDQMAEMAVASLMRMIDGTGGPPSSVHLPAELILRESS